MGFKCEGGRIESCPRGYYCEAAVDPVACPPGTFNNQREQIDSNACTPCPAGYYCPRPGLSSGTLYSCAAGFFCNEGKVTFLNSRNKISTFFSNLR